SLDEVDHCAHQLMNKAQSTQNTFFSGQSNYLVGSAHMLRGNYDLAEEHFKLALDILVAYEARDEIARSWRGMGRIALYRGYYQQAYDYHVKYLAIAESLGNIRERGAAHIAICSMLIVLHNYPEAEYHAAAALSIAQNSGFQRMIPAAL